MKNLSDIINNHHNEIAIFIDGVRNESYKKGKTEGRAEAIDEFIDKVKELYPNDSNALYKLMCIAGRLKEKRNE